MGKTVILAAMPVESQLIWNQMENKEKNIFSGFRFWRGMLNGKEVVLGECGVGKVNAAMATQIAAVRCISDLASDATGEEYEKFEQLAAEKSARLMLDAIGCLEE